MTYRFVHELENFPVYRDLGMLIENSLTEARIQESRRAGKATRTVWGYGLRIRGEEEGIGV